MASCAGQVQTSGGASTRIAAVDELFDIVVLNELATIGCGQALLDSSDKPLVVADESLHRLANERFFIPSLLGSYPIEL